MSAWQENFAKSPRGWNDTPGPALSQLPGGLASAPVGFTDIPTGARTELRFIAGMFGVVEDKAGVLSTEFGWTVTHDPTAK